VAVVFRPLQKPLIIFIAAFSLFLNLSDTMAEKSYRVLVLPMQIHSDRDLAFLKKGVQDMLYTRLALGDKVIVIDNQTVNQALQNIPGPVTEQSAYQLGQQLGADYVVWGSLTILGESISTDARFLEVRTQKPVVMFSQYGKTQGDVIFHIDQFAGQVNETVFGRKTYTYIKEAPAAAESSRRKHPESLWVKSDQQNIAGDASGSGYWNSGRFKTTIVGISIGDVNGDGKNETVTIDARSLEVHRFMDGRLAKIKKIEQPVGNVLIAVDVADINGNGFAEIFVTSLNKAKAGMNSFVLEWNGETFVEIIRDQNWYYRVTRSANRGVMLLGQKRGTEGLFSGGVTELTWSGSNYTPSAKMDLPKGQRIFGFAFGDVMNNNQELIIHYTPSEYLRIEDSSRGGREIWTSGEKFGGSANFLDNISRFDTGKDTFAKSRYFIPQRIFVVDIDKDGQYEVITPKNEETITRTLTKLRAFKSGNIQWLTWSGNGLFMKMKTQDAAGYISDLAIGDFDNDGEDDLVYTISQKSFIGGGKKSYIAAIKPQKSQ
jgi:TolB-like protein